MGSSFLSPTKREQLPTTGARGRNRVIRTEQAQREQGRPGYTVALTVADDGIGFDVAKLADTPAGGHVGLLLLQDLARTAGGSPESEAAPARGTLLRLCGP